MTNDNPPEMSAEERSALLQLAQQEGWTLKRLGDALGVSRERARQLLVSHGLRPGKVPRSTHAARKGKPWAVAANRRGVSKWAKDHPEQIRLKNKDAYNNKRQESTTAAGTPFSCSLCGHEWTQRTPNTPLHCPNCRTRKIGPTPPSDTARQDAPGEEQAR